MRVILTALIFLLGLFDLMIGASFLLNPMEIAIKFGIAPTGVQGLSTLRADFTAFSVDLMTAPAADILNGRAVLTVVDGVVVHRAESPMRIAP